MRVSMRNAQPDELCVDDTTIRTREEFDLFVDRLLIAAEALWPTPAEPRDAKTEDGHDDRT